MSKRKKRRGNNIRDANGGGPVGFLVTDAAWETLCVPGYTRLSENPEVLMGVNKLASLIGSMTIRLMANAEGGDVRIVNGLSRKVDITPNRYMTRMTLISYIVRTLLLEGNGNAVVVPRTKDGFLEDLIPIPAARVAFLPDQSFGYRVLIDGQERDPDSVLHFVLSPAPDQPWRGCGYRVALKDAAANLKQAAATKKGFMSDRWKPSIIIRVESWAEEMQTEEGQQKLREQFSAKPGEPLLLPAEGMEVTQVKPLTLNDLALNDSVTLDKKTVAAILGVPAFVLGAGAFNREEWNAFINTTVLPIVRGLEQELTRKLIISEEMFFRFNPWSLYSYDLKTLAEVGGNLFIRGIMDGNEVRDWIGQSPREGLNELIILENFIKLAEISNQLKLKQTGGDENG